MTTKILVAVGLLLAAGYMFLARRGDVTPDDARRLVANGATLLDVRTPGEFAEGHLPGALNIPVQSLSSRLGEVPKDKPVVVYCRSGQRSGSAKRLLKDAGFGDVHDLGAMSRW
jgi:rhodanese-related sulfurtransferase